jgi:formate--tetrahydrofolate ligase
MLPIAEVAATKLGVPVDALEPFGNYKAKISLDYLENLPAKPQAKLVLVSAMTPTPPGEGKTTTTVGLGDALNRIGKRAMICIREPSLGPCFGMKGGAAGGGRAQVVPMEDINLHFTGDFHAISAANNLLAALIDNQIYWGNDLGIDPRRVTWRRVVDLNDRALRQITNSLGGIANGFPRQDGFDITAASEVMAIFCLAASIEDLNTRLGNIIIGYTRNREPIYARQLKAEGPMTALLKDALAPNLVQTLENNPAFVHGGPFANIAHGCNSLIATQSALKMSDYVVTEAGFGADLGAEKFFNIKCRKGGLVPDAVVLVATVRALKAHGGVAKDDLGVENPAAVRKGFENLARHVENIRGFGLDPVVAINRFSSDSDKEVDLVRQQCAKLGVEAIQCTHWAEGSAGAEELAEKIVQLAEKDTRKEFRLLYDDKMSLWDKIRTVAQRIYGAQGIIADKNVRAQIKFLQDQGFGHYPVCIAKTQYSFSTDPNLKGAPSNHVVPVREVRLSNSAEFLVVICGEILTMPGLPRNPSAHDIKVGADGRIEGLF